MEAKAHDTITLLTKEKGHTLTIPDEVLADLSIEDGDSLEARVTEGRLILSVVKKEEKGIRLSDKGLAKLEEAEEDVRQGRVKRFESAEKLIADLNSDEG